MTTPSPRFPPQEALPRSVLVRNISPLATQAAVEDFFSFVCTIDVLRLRTVPANTGEDSTQEAIVIFTESRAKADAIVMDKSTIVDQPVSITSVPNNFDFNVIPSPVSDQDGFFSAFGQLFSGVGTAVATEMQKAGKIIDNASDTGVFKTAKVQIAAAGQRTRDLASDIDGKWHVSDNVRNLAESSRTNAANFATTVATQTKSVAQQVDTSLQISEQTGKLAERALHNPTVNSGLSAISGGFQTLLTQTGFQPPNQSDQPPADGVDLSSAPSPEPIPPAAIESTNSL